jgi:hypothetical protein
MVTYSTPPHETKMQSFLRQLNRVTMSDKEDAPWIIEREEEEADPPENSLYESDEKNRCKALEIEGRLGEALAFAEERTGSLLVLQNAPRHKSLELGRRVSTFRSLEDSGFVDEDGTVASLRSLRSKAQEPVFIKVPKGDPAILTQNSWESIMGMSRDTSSLATYEDDDEEDSENPKPSPPRPKIQQEIVLKPRKWDKLRSTIQAEQDQKSVGRHSGVGKGFKKIFRKRRKSRNVGEPNDTKNQETRKSSSKDPFPSPSRTDATKNQANQKSSSKDDFPSPCRTDATDSSQQDSNNSIPSQIVRQESVLEKHRFDFEDHVITVETRQGGEGIKKREPSLEELESLEVVYTEGEILPPFPSRMVDGSYTDTEY